MKSLAIVSGVSFGIGLLVGVYGGWVLRGKVPAALVPFLGSDTGAAPPTRPASDGGAF